MKSEDGYLYKDAAALAWRADNEIVLSVQKIDDYFVNMSASFAFKGEYASASFTSAAEYFLMEYSGSLLGKKFR